MHWETGVSARGGISETGSDIIPNQDKKRNKGAFVNKLYDMLSNKLPPSLFNTGGITWTPKRTKQFAFSRKPSR
jgi:hypothetical protein